MCSCTASPQVCVYMLISVAELIFQQQTVPVRGDTQPSISNVLPLSLPDPPAVMVRLDAASLSSISPPSFHLDLHGLLMDDMTLLSTEPAFLCSPIASLPTGVGVAVLTTVAVKHDAKMKVGH